MANKTNFFQFVGNRLPLQLTLKIFMILLDLSFLVLFGVTGEVLLLLFSKSTPKQLMLVELKQEEV